MLSRAPLLRWPALAAACALVLAAPSAASVPRPLPLFAAGALRRALALAVDRLETPDCRALYGDFRDAAGVTLAEKLRRENEEPVAHLLSLRFRNGAEHRLCANPRIFLVARVGSTVVDVCPAQFSELAVRSPRQAAGLLLHEQLHALGLGENPPASEDISRRVFERCGG